MACRKTILKYQCGVWLETGYLLLSMLGLAVSMSVGLLMIAFISNLRSYDSFHKNKDRIYRINSENYQSDGHTMTLASSSVRVGHKVRESFSGVEDSTIVRRGFEGDAEVNEKKIPLVALWADHAFLNVFTFPLIKGDSATALREPFSLVLTEKTAEKLFGKTDVIGEIVKFDTLNYLVTVVMEDLPKLSRLQFEALVSFSTIELQRPDFDGDFFAWENYYSNYTYVLLSENSDVQTLRMNLDQLSAVENTALEDREIINARLIVSIIIQVCLKIPRKLRND
jgi:putative ABC transport system permease protein